MSSSRFTQNPYVRALLFLIGMVLLTSCAGMPQVVWPEETPDPAVEAAVQSTLEAMGVQPVKPNATQAANTEEVYTNGDGTFVKFTPNWSGLSSNAPTDDQVLKAFGLTRDMLQMFERKSASWEPALWVIEFKPEFYGKVNLDLTENGYQVTVDSVNYGVITFYTDDPLVTAVLAEHGLSIRYMPTYLASDAGKRLADPALLVALENHFGRCYRNQNSGRADVPYFGRVGPYQTWPGNVYPAWTPPGLDETVVTNSMDAVAVLGGMLNNWTFANGNALWKSPHKGQANATAEVHYWQEFCVPAVSSGYVEIWLEAGQIGPGGTEVATRGSYKFYADDLRYLLDGHHAVDEMTYHSKND